MLSLGKEPGEAVRWGQLRNREVMRGVLALQLECFQFLAQTVNAITTAAGASAPYTITVNSVHPGLLAPSSFSVGGTQYVAALFSDAATFVLAPGAIAGVPSRRAKVGDAITLHGVGFGAVKPDITAGRIVQQNHTLAVPFHLFFGQREASLTYARLAPSAVGLYQFNVVVPSVPANDAVSLSFTLNGATGTQTLYIPVQ